MRSLIDPIRDEITRTLAVYRGCIRIAELYARLDGIDSTTAHALLAEQIGARLDMQADILEASWLARAVTFLPPPEHLRRDAAEWRREARALWAAARDGQVGGA